MSTDPKTQAATIREKGEASCPWDESTPLRAKWLCGYLEGALGNALQSAESLAGELAAMTADRDGWKDLADARKPNRILQTT